MALLNHYGEVIRLKQVARPRPDLVRPLREVKRSAIESALILCAGDKRLAAQRLGVSYSRMREWTAEFRRESAAD